MSKIVGKASNKLNHMTDQILDNFIFQLKKKIISNELVVRWLTSQLETFKNKESLEWQQPSHSNA